MALYFAVDISVMIMALKDRTISPLLLPCMYVSTLSILTITQRQGDDGVFSSKCSVGNGRVRDDMYASPSRLRRAIALARYRSR